MRAMFPAAPEEADSEVTEDGTACHWLAAEIWEGRTHPEGSLSPNHRVLTEDMFDAVDTYHGVLRSWPGVHAVCEQQIPINRIATGMVGTPDAWAYNPTTRTLYLADLKYGFRFVEVWANWQFICYLAGLLDLLQLPWDDSITIICTVVQPRSFHREGPVRTWRTTPRAILPMVAELQIAATSATRYTPNPGCFDCPGRHICVAYQNAAMRAVEVSYGGGNTHELDAAALGKELLMLGNAMKVLEGRKTGLEAQAESMLRNNKPVPGWVLRASFARETWKPGGDIAVMTLAEKFYKVVGSKPIKAITPAQMRKVLPTDIVAMFAHKPSTGVRMVKHDPLEAEKAFNQQ